MMPRLTGTVTMDPALTREGVAILSVAAVVAVAGMVVLALGVRRAIRDLARRCRTRSGFQTQPTLPPPTLPPPLLAVYDPPGDCIPDWLTGLSRDERGWLVIPRRTAPLLLPGDDDL